LWLTFVRLRKLVWCFWNLALWLTFVRLRKLVWLF
jgi:hypothetical protein